MRLLAKTVTLVVALGAVAAACLAADCTSSQGCTDCEWKSGKLPACTFVDADGYCKCDLMILFGKLACGVDGECDYTGGGGGGSGTGGTSDVCYRLPSEWCPAECMSCETVFWL